MKLVNRTPRSLFLLLLIVIASGLIRCASGAEKPAAAAKDSTAQSTAMPPADTVKGKPAAAAEILARKEIPILCYHQLRDYRPTDSKVARDYIVPPAVFSEQMQTLADSGYHTVLPDQLYDYLLYGKPLPPNPVMITFDDTDLEQFTVGAPELKKHGFKGVFFVMTVSIGRPHYMSKEQIRALSDEGHVIGSHTWDHHNVKKYAGTDWETQIEKPTRQLETITGKKIVYFAYPFGLWNEAAIPELKKRNMIAAFQLYAKRDETDPLFTIRRIIITGSTGKQMLTKMRTSFK